LPPLKAERDEVMGKMRKEMETLEKAVDAGAKEKEGGLTKVAEYDEERKSYLKQWIEGEQMV
jgi:hypothetical protein